jgi:hypothetical protein
MTYMGSWKSHRLTSHTWLGLNSQIGRPLSRIVGAKQFFARRLGKTLMHPKNQHLLFILDNLNFK